MPDPVWRTGLNAAQARPHVDFVDQDFHVLRELGVRIDRLRSVAEDAHLNREARSAVADQGIVALITGIGGHDGARHADRVAVGNEVENIVGGFAPFVERAELGQIALRRNANGVSHRGIEVGRCLGFKGICVVADSVGGEGAAGIGGCLGLRWILVNGGVGYRRRVGDILGLAGWNIRRDEPQRNRTFSGYPQSVEGYSVGVHDRGTDGDRAVFVMAALWIFTTAPVFSERRSTAV